MTFDITTTVQSLYIHWPFCPYKCHYCPFIALASHDAYMADYHRALKKEIQQFSDQHVLKAPIKTIFLGGGTPSTYPEELLLDMFDTLVSNYELDRNCEITIEVNPGTITQKKLDMWKCIGINRLSIGVQSLNDAVLTKLNRHQKAADVIQLIEWASPLFDNISIDLIIGLPGIRPEEWKNLIETIVHWPIKHVSLYVLMVHEDTPLYFGVKGNRISLPCDDEVIDLYEWSIETLANYGFGQYEISNFSQSGYASQHNMVYWQRMPYKGFGLGACSFDGKARLQNEKNLMSYLSGIENAQNIAVMYELLSEKDIWIEKLMLGIRQLGGVYVDPLLDVLTPDQRQKFCENLELLQQAGLVICDHKSMKLTPRGRALEQEVAVRLCIR